MKGLRDINAFLNKPGGYAWVYRDLRLNVLRLIETQIEQSAGSPRRPRTYEFFGQLRGRMHGNIADWYFKAFCGTGHITPLLESVHHRFQAMIYMPFYKRGERSLEKISEQDRTAILKERFLGYHKALNLLLKNLKLARPSLNFWLSEASAADWLDFASMATNLSPAKETNPSLPDIHAKQVEEYKALNSEHTINSFTDRIADLRSEAAMIIQETLDAAGGLSSGRSVPTMLYGRPGEFAKERLSDSRQNAGEDHFHTVALQEVNFRARIMVSLRSKGFDLSGVVRSDVVDAWPAANAEAIAAYRKDWVWENLTEQRKLCSVAQLLSELAYLLVKRAKLEGHSGLENTSGRWVEVCMVCYEALAVCDHIDSSQLHFDTLLQTKVLTLYGLALGYLGRFFEANRRLSEAEALLGKASLVSDPLELSKILMRRAEVNLREAAESASIVRAPTVKEEGGTGLIRELLGEFSDSAGDMQKDAKRVRASKIDDAWVLIERARQLLSGRSHSTMWWGRWITLCLRAYGTCGGGDLEYETLPFSRVIDPSENISNLFDTGFLLADSDPYLKLRLIDYCFQANRALSERQGALPTKKSNDSVLMRHLIDVQTQCRKSRILVKGTLLGEYYQHIEDKIS